MQSQRIKSPTDNDLRRLDNELQTATSRDFYMKKCDDLMGDIERICEVAKAGEKVVLVDRWGEETTLVLFKDEEGE